MAANKIISFRIDDDFTQKLASFSNEGESLNDTARRLLSGIVDGAIKPKTSDIDDRFSELWTVVDEMRGKLSASVPQVPITS